MSDIIPPDPNPRLPAHRQKAYRLRKAVDDGQEVSTEDAAFLAGYEGAASRTAVGASRNSRRMMVEEESVAVGTGDAALIAASAAQAREEGKRLDSLLERSTTAMETACRMYEKMVASVVGVMEGMSSRCAKLEEAHVKMFETMRENQLARVDAEMDLIEAERDREEKPDITTDLVQGLMKGLQAGGHTPGPTKKS